MAINVLLRAFGERTECYQLQGCKSTVEDVCRASSFLGGVRPVGLRVRVNGLDKNWSDEIDLSSECVQVEVLGRLLGGKGGFGTLLRGKGARGPKTSNFESSRDLQGRRLRVTEAPTKMKQWVARRVQEKAIIKAVGGEDKYLGKQLSAREVIKKYKLQISENSHDPFKDEDKDAELDQQNPFKEQMTRSAADALSHCDIATILQPPAENQSSSPTQHKLDRYLDISDDIDVF